jgi:hypothetical protein
VFASGKSVVVHAAEPDAPQPPAPLPGCEELFLENNEVEVHIEWNTKAMTAAQRTLLYEITNGLKSLGFGFDTGGGGGCYDWEWDWSLSGPVHVYFRCFSQSHVKNRYHYEKNREDRSSADLVEGAKTVQELLEDGVCETEEESS